MPLFLALLLTSLNAAKPPHVDDFIYLRYAHEFAAHPARPYDFVFLALPANEFLAPPVLPGWLGLGMSLFGESITLLKFWLFPFAWLFTSAVASLFRRFTPNVADPLVWFTVLSPGMLPSFNFMLEIPVLGLSLTALALTIKSCEGGRWCLILLAAVGAGLSLETKYTAFAPLVAALAWCWRSRRLTHLFILLIVSAAIFLGWEICTALQEGGSHFLLNARQRSGLFPQRIIHLLLPLIAVLGGLMPATTLLGFAALGSSNRTLATQAMVMITAFLALAFLPAGWTTWGQSSDGKPLFTLVQAIDGVFGLMVCAVLALSIARIRRNHGCLPNDDAFLLLWLGIEIAWYFLISPTPAARRVLGLSIPGIVLLGRLANRTCTAGRGRRWVIVSAFASAMLGFLFFAVDRQEACASERAAGIALHGPYQPEPGRSAWVVDQHGFGFDTLRAGLKSLILDQSNPVRGDVVFISTEFAAITGEISQRFDLREIGRIVVADGLTLRTYPNFYAGSAPLRHLEGPRYTVRAYRVVKERSNLIR
jgi:hypothetical protein